MEKKVEDLLDALAGFVLATDAWSLDSFLTGYVGKAEWGAIMERARARREKALLRQTSPEMWSD